MAASAAPSPSPASIKRVVAASLGTTVEWCDNSSDQS